VSGSGRRERAQLIQVMRAGGKTWVEIAEEIRDRYGVNARVALRWAHGWTQERVAREWCARWPDDPRTGQNLSTWERWPEAGHEPSVGTLSRLAEIYECDLADVVADLGHFRHLDRANAAPVVAAVQELANARPGVSDGPRSDSNEATDRRDFTRAAVLTALGLTDSLRQLAAGGRPGRAPTIGPEHVALVENAVERIEAQDAAAGAGGLRDSVDALHHQVEQWLNGPYSLHHVGDELQGLLGELSAWAGWLAFDAEDHARAGHYLQDALVRARLADDPRLEVRAFTYICLLTRDRRPRESLQCAQAALRLARGWSTPRLTGLLHLRAARAHAALGEAKAFGREMAHAYSHLDRGPHEDDPLYVGFVTPMEAAGIAGLSYLALGKPDRAASEFQNIAENPDPFYRRNVAYYTVRFAQATAAGNDIAGASEIGLEAIPVVAGLESSRTHRLLGDLRTMVEPHRRSAPAAGDFADAYAAAFPT
jgi:hypothetical protein